MNRDSRVLLVIADSSRSGGPEHVLTLAQELTAAGWVALVCCPPGELVERSQAAGLAVAPIRMAGRGWASAPIQLRQLARRWRASLVHSHGLRAGALVRRARTPAPHVHTHHLDGWFTASPLRVAIHRRELQALGRSAQLEIAVSNAVAEFLTQEVGVDSTRIRVVANGIQPLPVRERTRAQGRRVGVLARLTQSKGVDIAILALTTPAGRGLTLDVGGSGPELAALVDLAYLVGVADRVNFVGEVTDRESFFANLDLAWVPSRAEPFGLTACEAMSSGLPVVASRVGGLSEILDPPRAGLVVGAANPAALASVSAALLSDPARYAALSAAGVDRVRRRFSAARMGALTRGVYREAIGPG
ncbi:MAG TPA: glycosyltransferase family 4 protein [Candidatus Dormibacteraeota bacterium]|nr:glycosyltransferase family 4 protein [Candidatus Dormibacteraeota bacterium]